MSELTFGAWLRSARSNHQPRISQERLAELTGIERSYLSRIENDHVAMPTYETRQRIHQALGTSDEDVARAGVVIRPDLTFVARPGPPTHDQWGRPLPPHWIALGEDPDELPVRATPANPFDPSDLRWHVVEALRSLDMTAEHNEWLMQMFLRELRSEEVARLSPAELAEDQSKHAS